MRNLKLLVTLGLVLTACGKVPSTAITSLSSAASSGGSDSPSASDPAGTSVSASGISTSMTQRYLYAMHDGLLQIIPIDSTTGELIQVEMGDWLVKPVSGAGNFYTMAMNSTGTMIYALLKNTVTGSKIYQYSVSSVAYEQYGSDRPLTDSGLKVGASNPGLLSWANNGNLFIQNYNYTPSRVDSYTPNATTGLLSTATTIGSETTMTVTYALSFNRIVQASFDAHSYSIDAGTNHILHYKDGVLQSSFDAGAVAAITDLALK